MNSIEVKGTPVRMKDGYFSLTDIAKNTDRQPNELIRAWLRNQSTLLFLEEWEAANGVKDGQFPMFSLDDLRNNRGITISRYIERGGTGIISSSGRTGGTYAHIEIALEFAAWLDPKFKVWFFKEWVRMKEAELENHGLEWTLNKMLSNSLENQILIESIQDALKMIKAKQQKRIE